MSKYDTQSLFPAQVDSLIFFSDIRLEHEIALGTYKQLIEEKKYDEAVEYLETHTEVDAYCADLFNMLINRVRVVQAYANGEYVPVNNNMTILGNVPSNTNSYNGQNVLSFSNDSIT